MCSCEHSYQTACGMRNEAWWLYNVWYNDRSAKIDYKAMFRAHPDMLKGISEGRDIKILLYSKLRKATRAKMLAWRRYTQHGRYNAFAAVFYGITTVSPSFTRDIIFDCLVQHKKYNIKSTTPIT